MLNSAASLPPPTEYQKPRFVMPRGACDSHTHVIPDSGWTLVPEATYTPAPAPAPVHLSMLDSLGLERGVAVQPSIFGTDNTAVIEAIARAPQRLRGVAVVDPSIADSELQKLHAQGIRGARFNVMLGGGGGFKAMTELAPRLAALNWHAEILVDGHLLPELQTALQALPCRLVIDHMASLRADVGLDSAPVRALRTLVTARDTWVKLSGTYRLADQVSDSRLAERGRMLVKEAPDRMVWGSDWPHVACAVMPDAGELLNVLAGWFDADQAVLQRILADNPARLFDFPAVT
ncbi:amidohydrolase family protein [Diaphorobacter caeni]|uniref:amidohydrolase family protein n=1 Tax=Diaphorobacter caeni TaxID=2784387 RepID=UPI00188EB329|nr:amidohydrolase family protein [Diaphorobacter caeni]MBF5006903.1 amidohydrolase family protein [Diaphorobacter caeni]